MRPPIAIRGQSQLLGTCGIAMQKVFLWLHWQKVGANLLEDCQRRNNSINPLSRFWVSILQPTRKSDLRCFSRSPALCQWWIPVLLRLQSFALLSRLLSFSVLLLRGISRGCTVKAKPKKVNPKKTCQGAGKGKKGKPEQKPEKRRQQCIPFCRGACEKGDHCNYEHQVYSDGQPIPVGPEILQKDDEAVKRFNDNKAQAKAKSAQGEESEILSPWLFLVSSRSKRLQFLVISACLRWLLCHDELRNQCNHCPTSPRHEWRDSWVQGPKCNCTRANCSGPRLPWRTQGVVGFHSLPLTRAWLSPSARYSEDWRIAVT